jgi:L-lactate utilization protein LutC
MKAWNEKAKKDAIDRAVTALKANGIETFIVANKEEARKKVLSLIPEKAEVLTMTSITLDDVGLSRDINESGRFTAVRPALMKMDPKTQASEQRKLGAAPDYAVGSVHAVTESGTVMIASLTGSQQPAYAYGAGIVIWVVGAQKIVKDVQEGMKRIDEYLIDRESARAIKAYGLPGEFRTFPSKVLLFNREVQQGRVKLVLIDEVVGH